MTQELDWNLLPVLDVLLAESSVTAAADRLHLSVPATSRALGRLRRTFDDPILVRSGRGVVPTDRALTIRERLRDLIEEVYAIVELGRELDLVSLRRTFTIRGNDALISQMTAGLIERIAISAPGVSLRFVPEGDEDLEPLRAGIVDLDIGVIDDLGPEVRTQTLYEERLVGMVAVGHPLASGRMTLRRIAAARHVTVSRRGRPAGAFDRILEDRGLRRSIVAVVPSFTSAVDIIVASDLTGLIPSRYGSLCAAANGAHLYEIPAELPLMPISQAWHIRHDRDPAHVWLRDQVSTITREPGTS